MTIIAFLDTDGPYAAEGIIDCMVGLPATSRAPTCADFHVRTSGSGDADIIGVTAVAGRQRNAYRLTVRFKPDAGLLSVRYMPPAAESAVVPRSLPPIEVSVVGSPWQTHLTHDGDEWHVPADKPAERVAPNHAAASRESDDSMRLAEARILPLIRPAPAEAPPAAPREPARRPAAVAGVPPLESANDAGLIEDAKTAR